MSQRLGDLLVKEKVITPEQLEQAVKVQKETHVRLASALVKLGFLSDEDVTQFLVTSVWRSCHQPFLFSKSIHRLSSSFPSRLRKRYQILPLSRVGCVAHDRHGRSDQCVRNGRHQVHDGLQYRAGGSVGELDSGRASIRHTALTQGRRARASDAVDERNRRCGRSSSCKPKKQEMDLGELEQAAEEAPIAQSVNPDLFPCSQTRRE